MSDVQAVWTAYHLHHPRCDATPGDTRAKLIRSRLAEYGLDDLVLLLEWAHGAPHHLAKNLREKFPGLDYMFRKAKVPDRIDLARAWDAAGRPAAGDPGAEQIARVRRMMNERRRAAEVPDAR